MNQLVGRLSEEHAVDGSGAGAGDAWRAAEH